jgi:hypothetical protein
MSLVIFWSFEKIQKKPQSEPFSEIFDDQNSIADQSKISFWKPQFEEKHWKIRGDTIRFYYRRLRCGWSDPEVSPRGNRCDLGWTLRFLRWVKVSKVGSKVSKEGSKVSKVGYKVSKVGSKVSKVGSKVSKVSKVGSKVSKVGSKVSKVGSKVFKVGSIRLRCAQEEFKVANMYPRWLRWAFL